jgi:hypothetical protein
LIFGTFDVRSRYQWQIKIIFTAKLKVDYIGEEFPSIQFRIFLLFRVLFANLKIKIHETIILYILYGYETWSLILRGEH